MVVPKIGAWLIAATAMEKDASTATWPSPSRRVSVFVPPLRLKGVPESVAVPSPLSSSVSQTGSDTAVKFNRSPSASVAEIVAL